MKCLPHILIFVGSCILFAGISILVLTYYQLVFDELRYAFFPSNSKAAVVSRYNHPKPSDIVPIDEQFGIVIPKINANSKIVPEVDPYDPKVYQWALTKGVAQAKGSALPYETGTMFLFSHSSVDFYEAVKYNSIFYLLDKLTMEDSIYVFYKGQKYTYQVTGKQFVDPTNISYLTQKSSQHTLILMTCWPPGTTWKRLLILADLKKA